MNIVLNKDIETDYRNEFIKGFSTKEFVFGLTGIAVGIGLAIFLYVKYGVDIKVAVYPCMIPGAVIIFFGFMKFRGMSAPAYLKEILWEMKTKKLTYDTGTERRTGEFAPKAHKGIIKQCPMSAKEIEKMKRKEAKIYARRRKAYQKALSKAAGKQEKAN